MIESDSWIFLTFLELRESEAFGMSSSMMPDSDSENFSEYISSMISDEL